MPLQHLGFIDLPPHARDGGFDHAAVHEPTGRIYVAHTANDTVDVIDVEHWKLVGSIGGLSAVAGALVAEPDLVFTSNRGEVEDDEVEEFRVRPEEALLTGLRDDHLVVFALESLLEGSGHLRLVFDDQYLHVSPRCCILAIISQNVTILKRTRAIAD